MRYSIKQLVMTVALLLSTTMAWAAGEVTIIQKLNGSTSSSAGTVTQSISGGKCTLTVTPAEGNYITVDFITAERTVSGGIAQAPRRRTPGMDNNITVTAESSSADPSGVTKYTFDMPGADYDVEVVADFQKRSSISGAVITLTETSFTYTGQEKTPAIQSVVVSGKSLSTNEYSVEYSNNTNAGKGTVTVTGLRTYNGTATAEFTIGKATITPSVTLQGWTYGADANTPVVSGNTDNAEVTYTYAIKGSTSYSATVPAVAGTYTVKATIAETANYQGAEATADFTIGKATITPTVSLQGWTYNGQANTPVVSGNTGNGAVTYTYAVKGSSSYSAAVPTAAGTYTVKATIAETANYQGAEATADFTIGKATISPTVTLQGWTYNGQANTPVVSGNTGNGAVTYTYAVKGSTDYSATVPTAAGTYTVKATIAETTNYQGAEATADFTIGKATITPTVTLQGWTYNGQANTPVVSGNTGNGAVTYTYAVKGSSSYSSTVPTAAGTYTVKATIAETANYQGAEATADFTIGKATITPTVILQGWTYNGQANTPVVSGNTGNGAVTYTYAVKGSASYSATVPSAAGTYTVKATIAETANYQGAEATADFTIGKATITPTVTLQGWTYNSQANTPVVSGNTGNGTVTYTYAVKGSASYSATVPSAAGTYTVKATIAETANYQGAEATADFTIGKATITPTVTLQGWTYNSQANTPVVSGNTGNGAVTYTYAVKGSTDYSSTVPSAAGTYTVKAIIAETANYQAAEATADFTIGKATITPTVTLQGWTYNSQANTPVVSGNTGNGAVTYTYAVKGSTTFSATVPSAAGTYTVKATIAETANYQGAEATADFTIGKATITPTVTLQGWTYNSQANTPVVSGNTGNGAVTYTYAVKGSTDYSSTVPSAAGTYTVKAIIAETANYQAAEATADFTIGKATITPTVTLQGWTYNSQANTPVVSGNTGNGAVTYTYAVKGSTTFSATVPTAAGTYTVKATIAETANYQGAEATADFTIGKATITPTVTLQGWTYNSQANTPVVSGNTGNGAVTYTYAVKGSTDFSATVPTAAGTYTVKATIAETTNYQGAEATADFTIGKATITPTVTLQGWTYNSQANTPVVSGNTGNGAVTYTYAVKGSTDFSATVPTAAGTYTVKATIAETANYQGAEATADFTIGKATITPTVTLQGWTYNGQANTPVVSGNTGNGTVTYSYAVKGSSSYSAAVPTAAGTYTVKAIIAETANYQGAEASADFTIGKATISPTVTLQGWTYNGQANIPVVSGNTGNGTVTYSYAVKGSTDFSATVPTAAGTYTVKATIAETANYQGAEATADFTIGKATITPTVTLQGWTYNSQANTPVVSGNTGNGAVTYTYAVKGSTDFSATVPTAAGTYTVKATIAETANYQGAEATADFTIGKTTFTPTVTLQGWAFGAEPNSPVVTGNLSNGAVTFTYKAAGATEFTATVPTAAGTHTVKATIAATDNYEAAEATATFSIGKASFTPTVTIEGWTYGDQANAPVVTNNLGGGAVTFTYSKAGNNDFKATVPSTAGNYIVKATIAETANYQGAEATAEFTIAKATFTPVVTLQGWAFGADPNTPVVTGNLSNGAVTFTYKAAGTNEFTATVPTAAGTHTVKATIAATDNYEAAEATATFSIGKASFTPTVTIEGWIYGEQANAPVVTNNLGGGAVRFSYSKAGNNDFKATVPSIAGNYIVKATIAETANYQGAEATAEFTIAKATFTPVVTLQGWAFGADPNTPVVTGNLSNGAVTFTYKAAGATEFTATVPTAAGTHTVKATIAATDNYEAAEATATFSIGKASFTPTVTIEGWTYGGQANAPVVTNNLGGGEVTFTYSKAGNNDFKATVPSIAGNYIVKATIAETVNYQGAEATAEFTIAKAAITPTVTLQGWVFGDEPNTPVVDGNLGDGQVTFTYAAQGTEQFSTEIPTAAGNYIVKATIAETENYLGGEATAEFTIEKVWLLVNGIKVTEQNRRDILNDNGSVTFNGNDKLVLTQATINGDIQSYIDKLVVYLKEDNKINGSIIGEQSELVFTTDGNSPGKLAIQTETGSRVISGFNLIIFEQNLTLLSGSYDAQEAVIGTAVKPIVDEDEPENTVDLADTGGEEDLSNTIINDVLYTLDSDNDDGIDPEDNSVVLGSTMADEDIDDVIENYTPGTDEFAEHFAGVTFMIPAGTGEVIITAKTGEEGILHVKIGSSEPKVFTGILEYTEFRIPYACTQATYVYIYNASPAVETTEAPNHRAVKKTTVTVGLSSVGVNASGMQSSNDEGNVDADTKVLSDDDVTYDLENGTLYAINSEVTTIADEAFVSFPFLKFIDLRNTQITGINVSREEGPFKGVSKNTFIYLPTGNTTDEPNVIIGNICESVVLDGDMPEEESFGLSESFVASSIEFNRIFKKDETTTLCLPFDICASDMLFFGHLYQVKSVEGTYVKIEEVTDGLKAHVPYLFKASTNDTQLYTLDVVEMSMPQVPTAPQHRAGNYAELVGCYEPFSGEGETQVFLFLPNDDPEQISFVRIHDEDIIKPFQAYLFTDAEGDTLGVTDKEITAIDGIANSQQSANDHYYDLQGRRIANGKKPTAKGVYIVNGQKKYIR